MYILTIQRSPEGLYRVLFRTVAGDLMSKRVASNGKGICWILSDYPYRHGVVVNPRKIIKEGL